MLPNAMIDPLDALLAEHEMPQSKPYRRSGYTVREFCALPYAKREEVDRECDERAGLVYETYSHKLNKPFTVGSRKAAA